MNRSAHHLSQPLNENGPATTLSVASGAHLTSPADGPNESSRRKATGGRRWDRSHAIQLLAQILHAFAGAWFPRSGCDASQRAHKLFRVTVLLQELVCAGLEAGEEIIP